MSTAEPGLDDVDARVESFVQRSRQQGLKVTPQRLGVFRALASTRSHPTAEELHRGLRVQMPTLSLDTVYRTLSTLQEHGVISRVEVLDDRCRFDANPDVHHHFVCMRCRKVMDLYWPELEQLQRPDTGAMGVVQQVHAELRGTCHDCQDGAGTPGRESP